MAICDELFETLLGLIDKPYDYNQLVAKLLCQALQQSSQIEFVDGVPMMPDPGRGKTLSISRSIVRAGDFGQNISDRYLSMDDIPSMNKQGFLLPRPATLTGLWAKSRSTGGWIAEVRRNGVELTVAGISVSGGSGENSNINIDLDEGDVLQIYASGMNVEFPLVKAEIAWREA